LDRFRAADTQVLGISIDSVYCHANWAKDLGGVSFPLLADFEPKGAAAAGVGHYLTDAGITDRASVILDKDGVVRYSASVTPSGQRDIAALAAECEKVNAGSAPGSMPKASAIADGAVLYVKSQCGASRKALLAIANLHLEGTIAVRNISEDASAKAAVVAAGGKDQAPCLVIDNGALYESDAIVTALVGQAAPI